MLQRQQERRLLVPFGLAWNSKGRLDWLGIQRAGADGNLHLVMATKIGMDVLFD